VLLGDKNWYFPTWLEWLPRLDGEGETTEVETPSTPAIPAIPAAETIAAGGAAD